MPPKQPSPPSPEKKPDTLLISATRTSASVQTEGVILNFETKAGRAECVSRKSELSGTNKKVSDAAFIAARKAAIEAMRTAVGEQEKPDFNAIKKKHNLGKNWSS